MHYLNKKYPILILGPDTKRLLLDSLNLKNFFYFSPEESELVWNFSLIHNMFRYFIKFIKIEATIGSKLKSAYFAALIKASFPIKSTSLVVLNSSSGRKVAASITTVATTVAVPS